MLVEIAQLPFELHCRHQENRDYLREYQTQRAPLFCIEPRPEDLEDARVRLVRSAELEGLDVQSYSDAFLENNAIHSLLAEELAKRGALLMHGSALCMDGEAYIFIAPSGTGKSTHARLWREVFGERVWMINDDKPVLRIGETGATVYGTPWNGKHRLGCNASAPLRAIVLLSRGDANAIAPLDGTEAFAAIYRQCYVSPNAETMRLIAAMEAALVRQCAVYRLHCTPTPEAALVAWRGMNQTDRTMSSIQ